MKKYLVILALGIFSFVSSQGAKGTKIGYFDMNRILKSVPDFAEANNQLELRAQTWKKEIDDRQAQINLLKEELKTERVLLTKELIEEKEEEITFLEQELSDYQQKRFGPTGDLFTQKAVLVKPIQDQVFIIVNDIADRRKYDLIYDISSASAGLIYASQKYDMNDEIINALVRAEKREQGQKKKLSKEEEQAADDKKYDPDLKQKEEERQAKIDERQQKIDDRKAQQDKKRQEQIDKREQQKADREKEIEDRKNNQSDETDDKPKKLTKEEREAQIEARKKQIQEQREQKQKEREDKIEQRKKEIEERKNKQNKPKEENEE